MNMKLLVTLVFLTGATIGVLGSVLYDRHQEKRSVVQLMEEFPRTISNESLDEFYDRFFDDDFFKDNEFPFKQMEELRSEMDKMFEENLEEVPSNDVFDNWFKESIYLI